MSYLLSVSAVRELDEIWQYIAEQSGSFEISDRVVDSITDRFLAIVRNPGIGRSRDDLQPGYRSFPVGQYVIFYRATDDRVEILHVLHGKRDLGPLLKPE
jgi:toxin ParE1/3/4